MKIPLSILFTLSVFIAKTQPVSITLDEFVNTILLIDESIPKETSFAFETDYFFFEEHDSKDTTLILHADYFYQAKNQLLNFNQFDKKIIQSKELLIICDTINKEIVINHPNEIYLKRRAFDDFKILLESECKVFKEKQGDFLVYTIKFAQGAKYEKAMFWVNKKQMISKYILYSGRPILDGDFLDEKPIHPRLEVHFKNYVFGKKVDQIKLLKDEDIFSDVEALTLTTLYKDYKIIDLRYNN